MTRPGQDGAETELGWSTDLGGAVEDQVRRPRESPAAPKPPDRGRRRLGEYVALVVGLGLVAVWTLGDPRVLGPEVAVFPEVAAAVLALVVGALALVRYYAWKRRTFLYIGTGFLGTAVLDFYHVLVVAPAFPPGPEAGPDDAAAWSWLASRLFLAFYLAASWLAWILDGRGEETFGRGRELSIYLTTGVLTVVILALVHFGPLGPAYHDGAFFGRPVELVPALLLAVAAGGYLSRGGWRRDPFDHWLVCSLLAGVLAQVGFVAPSQVPLDLPELVGRVVKLGSYAMILVGLLASVRLAFRQQVESSEAVVAANEALAGEVRTRRQAEEVLQRSEERLQDFLDHANDLIQSTDPEGRILYVNHTWKRTLGYMDREVKGMQILSVVHPRSRDAFREILERVLEGEAVEGFEVVFQAADGEAVALAGSSTCRFRDGTPVATRTIFRDITEQAQAERELARSQANLEALFESTGDAIWSVDIDHRLVTFNTAFALTVEALTGRAPQPGDPVEDVVAPWEVGWFRNCYDRALAGNRFVAGREEKLGDTLRFYELYFHPFETPEGPGGVVVFSKDITRRREVEEALRQAKSEAEEANRAKSDFMASMSHELRTPLNSVIGFANLMLKRGHSDMPARDREFLERILANGKHLLSLINQILDLSKIESGKMELEVERVDLRELIPTLMDELEGQVADRDVELRHGWNQPPRPIQTDPGKLKQVLINLVGNAIKFTEEGEVEVRVEADPDTGEPERIHVRDTGIGIPEDRLRRIFEAFRQADGTTSRRFGGTGLGLTISRSLCRLMGHELSVSSQEGVGSTFTIHLNVGAGAGEAEGTGSPGRTKEGEKRKEAVPGGGAGRTAPLPSKPERARGPIHPKAPPPVLKGREALVVESHVESQQVLVESLEALGCRAEGVASASEALALARNRSPDVVTCDLFMDSMSGWGLLEEMRNDPTLASVPLVMVAMSAGGTTGSRAPGVVDVIADPPVHRDVTKALQRSLQGGGGRALVIEVEGERRLVIQRILREAGLVVHSVEEADAALRFVGRVGVDLIVMELRSPLTRRFDLADRLRTAAAPEGVPALFFVRGDLPDDKLEALTRAPAGTVYKDREVAKRLNEVLTRHLGDPGASGTEPDDP